MFLRNKREVDMGFKENVEEYLRLMSIGDKTANKFYEVNLFDEVCSRFSVKFEKMCAERGARKYHYLIMPVGFSPEPLIMWIRAVKPDKCFFLHSKETEYFIDDIVSKTGLKPTQYKFEKVDSSIITETYKEIRNIIEKNGLYDKLDKVAIDITGGKKSMVSGCSLAASYLGIDTLYVDYAEYHDKYRKPTPGTEFPIFLSDPLEVFGDREINRGISKLNSGNFQGASDIFSRAKERLEKPKMCEAFEALAEGYRCMEAMNFDIAYEKLNLSADLASKYNLTNIPAFEIRNQADLLKPLQKINNVSEREMLSKPLSFWHVSAYSMAMSLYYFDQGRIDFSALLNYRVLEMVVQYLLTKRGINPSDAKYQGIDREKLIKDINEISYRLDPHREPLSKLPEKITLILGIIILQCLEDTVAKKISVEKMMKFSDLRNKSRFAHGFATLDADSVKTFYYSVEAIAEHVWNSEKESLGYKYKYPNFVKKFMFLKLNEYGRL